MGNKIKMSEVNNFNASLRNLSVAYRPTQKP